jgi:hypothetical protein
MLLVVQVVDFSAGLALTLCEAGLSLFVQVWLSVTVRMCVHHMQSVCGNVYRCDLC